MVSSGAGTGRRDVSFISGDAACAAWWYPATQEPAGGRRPCVVMAHGFSMTRGDGLARYAEAFAAAGAHVLVFDHRHLGDSGGEPRQRFRARGQRADWHNAVAYARSRAEVDPQRIVLWGFSFSSGHIAALLARGLGVAAAMVLCPFVDGWARVRATPLRLSAWIIPRAVADLLGRHTLIPVTGPPGSHAAMTHPGEAEGFAASATADSRWVNLISPALFLTVALFRPVNRAGRIGVPLWVGRCTDDATVDPVAVGRLADRAPRGELHEFPGDHFAPFTSTDDAVAAAQVAFLRRTVLEPTAVHG